MIEQKRPKKNKFLMFTSIGFELITLILIAIYGGEYAVKNGYPNYLKALLIIVAFVLWFVSLISKLRSIKPEVDQNGEQNND